MRTRTRSQRGFKLIELLVVMAILILLAGIIWVMSRSAREASARTQCINNLRQIAIATYQYMIDYQTLYASGFELSDYMRATGRFDPKQLFTCPSDRLFVPILRTASSYFETPITGEPSSQLLREHPNLVLFSCIHHMGLPIVQEGDLPPSYRYQTEPSWPFLIVLRLSGSVEFVHSCRVRQVRRQEDGRTVMRAVYPGEEGYDEATEVYGMYEWCHQGRR